MPELVQDGLVQDGLVQELVFSRSYLFVSSLMLGPSGGRQYGHIAVGCEYEKAMKAEKDVGIRGVGLLVDISLCPVS